MDKKNDKLEQAPRVDYTTEELAYRGELIQKLTSAKNQRDTDHTEFNDMDYYTWHEKNAKAANSYIPPKKNRTDTRIVTGTTQEKVVTLLSALLNYNLEPNIAAFDEKDNVINEIGENMEDLVRKSRTMEDYDEKRVLIYKELLDQGTCYVEEIYTENYINEKKQKFDWSEGVKIENLKWKDNPKKISGNCSVNLLSGTNVYLGNIKEYDISKQPFLFTKEIIPYSRAKAIYGKWERWENVPKKIVKFDSDNNGTTAYTDWSLEELETDMVEVIKYQNKFDNEFMIMLNGINMLPAGFPLTAISPSGEYTIVKGIAEPISKFFAYGKSSPSKSKADQEVLDEMLRMIVLKTQQSFMPPYSNRTKKLLSSKIFFPGTITPDIDANMLQPIGDTKGVSQAEFNSFELIKRLIDEKTVSPTFSGQVSQESKTATEILEVKKQQMMKLGLLIHGVMTMERQLAWLRVQNILEHWTKPVDKEIDNIKNELVDVYKSITVETSLENGQKGMKTIEFNPELSEVLTPEQIKAQEDFLSKSGKEVRKVYINPTILRVLKAAWYIVINPTEKDSSELDRVLFTQNIKDAAEIFGMQSLNMEYLRGRFAILAKEDPEKFFIKGSPMMPMPEEANAGGTRSSGKIGSQLAEGIQQPSLNELVGVQKQ